MDDFEQWLKEEKELKIELDREKLYKRLMNTKGKDSCPCNSGLMYKNCCDKSTD